MRTPARRGFPIGRHLPRYVPCEGETATRADQRSISVREVTRGSFKNFSETCREEELCPMQNCGNIIDDQAICMYEEMVKFHIESHKKLALCYTKTDLASLCYLNTEQLMKCLVTLFKLYDINRRSSSLHKNESEFYSFHVLLHLGGKIPQMQGSSLSLWYQKLTLSILQSNEMHFAMTLIRYSQLGNFKRFFTSLEAEASELQLCLVEPFLSEIRARAISYVNYSGYKLQPYPLKHLSDVLRIKESELEELCHVCGLETSMDEAGMKTLPVKQTSFSLPKLRLPVHSLSTP